MFLLAATKSYIYVKNVILMLLMPNFFLTVGRKMKVILNGLFWVLDKS